MSAPPSVSIEPTSPEHADELFVFEVENREFFEQWIAGRGDDYYSVENVRQSLSRADDDVFVIGPKTTEMHARAFVAAVLAPH